MSNENNLLSIEEYCEKHGIILTNELIPTIMIIQRHLENIEATYGQHILVETLKIMGLHSKSEVKRKKVA